MRFSISFCLLVVLVWGTTVQGQDMGPFEVTAETLPGSFFFFVCCCCVVFVLYVCAASFFVCLRLPDYVGPSPFPFLSSTGYVEVNTEFQRNNFYWLTESSSPNPDQDPLVFWYTGGPGLLFYALLFKMKIKIVFLFQKLIISFIGPSIFFFFFFFLCIRLQRNRRSF